MMRSPGFGDTAVIVNASADADRDGLLVNHVEDSREVQARATEEPGVLPDGSAIAERRADDALMR